MSVSGQSIQLPLLIYGFRGVFAVMSCIKTLSVKGENAKGTVIGVFAGTGANKSPPWLVLERLPASLSGRLKLRTDPAVEGAMLQRAQPLCTRSKGPLDGVCE